MTSYNAYVGKTIRITKEEFIKRVLESPKGQRINFDSINSQGGIYFSYALEKIEWTRDTLVLIGGYGNEIMMCNNNDNMIAKLIEDYFQKQNIGNEVFLELENGK